MKTRLTRRHLLAGTAAALLAAPAIVRAQGGRAQGRRAAAALRRTGRHRPGLLPRRRACRADAEGRRPARPADHECRHRDQRRGRALARREADRGRRAAADGRLRFRSEHRDRAGRRAEGHSVRHQHRGRARHHRAGLQVRVPQFPDRADDPGRCVRQPEGDLRRGGQRAEVGRVHARQRHVRHRDAARHRRRDADASTCPTRSRRRSPTIRPRAISRSRSPRPRRAGADALLVVSRLNDAILLTRELVKQRWTPQGVLSMGPGWYEDQYLKTLGKLSDGPLSFVPWYDPNKKMSQGARKLRSARSIRRSRSTPTTSIRSRRCWSRPTPTSAPARPIPRRSPTRSARPTSRTTCRPARASRSTPRGRTTS